MAAADVPETLSNICGELCKNYVITAPVDDPIKRDYGVFSAYAHDHPEIVYFWLTLQFNRSF
jgi:hypothetical protein